MKKLALFLAAMLLLSFASFSANAEVTEIRFANWDGGDTLKAYQEITDAFNALHEDIHVTILSIPEGYNTKVSAMVASGDIPEFCMFDADILYPMAEAGHIANMKDLMAGDPSYSDADLIDNLKVWYGDDNMIGYAAGPQDICMFYNPALFDAAGVEYPPANYADAWDWDTLLDRAKTLTIDANGNNAHSADFDPENIKSYGISFGRSWQGWMPFVLSNGGNFLTADGSRLGMDQPEAAEAVQRMADLINVYHVAPTPAATDNMGTTEALAANKVAMVIDGQWMNCTLMAEEIDYDVAALPKMGEQARTMVTYGTLCVMNTEKKDAAWEFFKYISACGSPYPLERDGLWLPSTKSGLSEDYIQKIMTENHPEHFYEAICKPILDGSAAPMVTSDVKNFTKIYNIFNPALDDVWFGKTDYMSAIAPVLDAANAEVDGWYYTK